MEDNLTRKQRLEQLSLGFSIVATYYNEYLSYDFETGLQRRNRDGGKNKHMTLFDLIWMKKYMSLLLTRILINPKAVHLGAIGTHFLEHFFRMVLRFCHGDNFVSSFQNSVENIVILKLIQQVALIVALD